MLNWSFRKGFRLTSIWLNKILTYNAEEAITQFQYLNIALACLGAYLFLRANHDRSDILNLSASAVLFVVFNFIINMLLTDDIAFTVTPALYNIITCVQLALTTVASLFLLCAYSFSLDQARR